MNKVNKNTKINILLILVLVIFHAVGLVGMLFFDRNSFIKLTWLNLLISTVIAFISYKEKIVSFIIPFFLVVTVTFFVEVIGCLLYTSPSPRD